MTCGSIPQGGCDFDPGHLGPCSQNVTISLHVDRCPTCHDGGNVYLYPHNLSHRCSDCDGRGWTLPGWPWVKVPTVPCPTTHADLRRMGAEKCPHCTNSNGRIPDPAWEPGAIVTLTADWAGSGQVPVGSAVITELVPVIVGHSRVPRPSTAFVAWYSDVCVLVGGDGNETDLDVDCVPGDLLARLEVSSCD